MAIFRRRGEEEEPSSQKGSAAAGQGMNREMKRMMAKREGAADRLRRPVQKKQRTKPLQFLKEVRGELARVAWPTRPEVMTYTVVVLISVAFFMIIIAGMDYVFARGVLWLLRRGG